jgi:hypothetical protein
MTLLQAAPLRMAEDRALNGSFLSPYEVLDDDHRPSDRPGLAFGGRDVDLRHDLFRMVPVPATSKFVIP